MVDAPREWLIRKGGYFYRPNCQGYTTRKVEAGRYTKADADREAAVEPWHMSAIHQDEIPDEPEIVSMGARIADLERQLAEARALLRLHHDHHLTMGTIGLPDGEGGYIEIDNGGEYSDSSLYERTEAALSDTPREWEPMPRGGIQAHWWQIGILERRKRKKAEVERDRLAAEVERLREALTETADALESRLTDDEKTANIRKPYEHPLSAYDRARATLRALQAQDGRDG